VTTATSARSTAVGRARLRSVWQWPTTTPGRLSAASFVLVLATVAFGAAATGEAAARRHGADEVASGAEPLLVEATGVYSSLSDADATATTTFLTGGLEPHDRTQRYLDDVRTASGRVAALSQEVGSSPHARDAIQAIAEKLPIYTGLIETARADNAQGFPVGAAYLRDASTMMQDEILPRALVLYETEASRLDDAYRAGTSTGASAIVVATGLALLALLLAVQVYLARHTHRLVNVPLLAATVVVIAAVTWVLVGFGLERRDLADAQRSGSDSVQLLSAARINALHAESSGNLVLVARGRDVADQAAADAALVKVGGSDGRGGLLGEARAVAERTGSTSGIDALMADLRTYLTLHAQIKQDESDGNFNGTTVPVTPGAVERAVGDRAVGNRAGRCEPPDCQAAVADQVDAGFQREIAAAQGRFDRSASTATSALARAWLAVPLAALLAAILVAYGLQLRIKEYR